MRLRSRLMLAFTALVVIPLIVVGVGIRYNVGARLTEQFQQRVLTLASVIQSELAQEGEEIASMLDALARDIEADNPFRRAVLQGAPSNRQYLLDLAGSAMRLGGLSMLQIQDPSGRIISSGHFRNEYDRLEPELPDALRLVPGSVMLVSARTATAPFLALVKSDSVRLGDVWFDIVGGISVGRQFLNRLAGGQELAVSLVHVGGVLSSDSGLENTLAAMGVGAEGAEGEGGAVESRDIDSLLTDQIVTEIEIPYVMPGGGGQVSSATILVTHPLRPLHELRRSIDVWFAGAVLVTAAAALLAATWLSTILSRPLAELARKTSQVDLDRLDVGFESDRKDEVGTLSRLLGSMTERLHKSAAKLKEIERRATVGEIARQVNHDIKNGLIPIRNVLRHLKQVAQDEPSQLRSVYQERQATLESSIVYLEDLAANYARLYPRVDRKPCDVNEIIRQLSRSVKRSEQVRVDLDLAERVTTVTGDPVALRRIVENLMRNAIEAVESGAGIVTVSTRSSGDSGSSGVRISVSDTGSGMTEDELEKAFEDFYTTKQLGTGLGLSVVRRLVLDLNGTLRVESEPGVGTKFVVELPGGANG
jgi:signal transduction histidine kinase